MPDTNVTNSLLDLPLNAANQIFEKLEPMDRLRSRKVCRVLRAAMDKLGVRFDTIHFSMWMEKFELTLDGIEIIYTEAGGGGSRVIYNGQEKLILEHEAYTERAFKDLKIVWKHVSKLSIFNCTEDGCSCSTVPSFIDFLKSEERIYVKEIALVKFSFNAVISMFPHFNDLESIELISVGPINQFNRLTHLAQWKKAQSFCIYDSVFDSELIVQLFHFKCFTISRMTDFSTKIAVKIRDNLMRRNAFQSCNITFDKSTSNPVEIAKVFNCTGENEFRTEYYSNDINRYTIGLKSCNSKIAVFSARRC